MCCSARHTSRPPEHWTDLHSAGARLRAVTVVHVAPKSTLRRTVYRPAERSVDPSALLVRDSTASPSAEPSILFHCAPSTAM